MSNFKLLAAAAVTAAGIAGAGFTPAAKAGEVMDSVMENGTLRCGVNTGLAGFSIADDQGNWTGLDVEYCRAVAAAGELTRPARARSFRHAPDRRAR